MSTDAIATDATSAVIAASATILPPETTHHDARTAGHTAGHATGHAAGHTVVDAIDREAIARLAWRTGDALCASALWDADGRRCNWVAHRDIEDREIAPYSERTAALSPELYSGSAGVALFLAELHAVSGDATHARTALGAWRRSVEYLRRKRTPAPPFSFHAGHLGVAWAGVRLQHALPDHADALRDDIAWLVDAAVEGLEVHHGLDQIGGNAGAIAPLLRLGDILGRDDCFAAARALGAEIVDKAQWKDDRCFWDFEKVHGVEMDAPPMTGFSHGASGIALGLLELYGRTADPGCLRTARGAFAFEHALFDSSAGNWVDTRYPHSHGEHGVTGVCRSAWCHGAPGIALALLRAAALDPGHAGEHLYYGRIALDSTRAFLDERREGPLTDATLCHGACGLSEIVLIGGELVGDATLCDAAATFMDGFARRFPTPGAWPSGLTTHAPTVGLMIGDAGVGLHALRVATRGATPSPLLFRP